MNRLIAFSLALIVGVIGSIYIAMTTPKLQTTFTQSPQVGKVNFQPFYKNSGL